MAVVEDIVEVEAFDGGPQAIEVDGHVLLVQHFGGAAVGEALELLNLEIVAYLPVVEVDTDFGAVEVEGELGLLAVLLAAAAEELTGIDGPTDEYPTPTEVGSNLVAGIGGEAELLPPGFGGADAVTLEDGVVAEHDGIVVAVGRDIGGVVVVEIDESFDKPLEATVDALALGPLRDGVGCLGLGAKRRRGQQSKGKEQQGGEAIHGNKRTCEVSELSENLVDDPVRRGGTEAVA